MRQNKTLEPSSAKGVLARRLGADRFLGDSGQREMQGLKLNVVTGPCVGQEIPEQLMPNILGFLCKQEEFK